MTAKSERSPSAAKERAEADVYEILVTLAGAAEDESSQSQFHAFWLNRGDLREYRFMGELGFGGKFRCDSRGAAWRVDCYPEDSTYHRKEIIQDTNSGLATLEAECVAADRLPDPAAMCECGHEQKWHEEDGTAECQGTNIAPPGSFVECECKTFVPVSAAVSPAEPPEGCPGPDGNGCDCRMNGTDPGCPYMPGHDIRPLSSDPRAPDPYYSCGASYCDDPACITHNPRHPNHAR